MVPKGARVPQGGQPEDAYTFYEGMGAVADRLGISGTNTYLCNNYTSPLHCDNNSGTSLCAQYKLQALSALDEYSFIHADYGLYIVSCQNSLITLT